MFSKGALVLALAAAARVSADAAADAKAAEAALVAELRLAPTASDRVGLLSDEQFVFDFFDPNAAATKGAGGRIVTANAATFPAVIGTNSAMAAGFLDACSMNTPHTHPRATEFQISVNSTIRTGMITENGARFVMTELPPGSATIFPMGSIHFQVNDGCEPALFIAAFNSEDPGVLSVAQRLFGLSSDIVGATLGDLGVEEVEGLEAMIPDNVAIATDACLQRCGLKRPSQPTLQLQPPASAPAPATQTDATTASSETTKASSETTTAYSAPASTNTHSASGGGKGKRNHLIKVGADGLTYTPSNISAHVGDTVTFEFHPKNHTVTQSSFNDPCHALVQNGVPGFKSGFMPVSATATTFPTFEITINDTNPIWGYCGQQGPPVHCQQGMVFSINAWESGPNSFAAFQQRARDSGSASASVSASASAAPSVSVSFGASASAAPSVSVSVGASAAPSASAGNAAAANKNLAATGNLADNTSGSGSSTPSPALIALLAINGALLVGLAVIGALYLRRRRAAARTARHRQLYTSIAVTGEAVPVFVEKPAGDGEDETHGLAHGPYYDPHDSRSR